MRNETQNLNRLAEYRYIHLKRVCSHLSYIVSNLRSEILFFYLLLLLGVGVGTYILHIKDNLIDGIKILDEVLVIENNILVFSL